MQDKIFNVGENVWFEPSDERDRGHYEEIITVGRKYYTTDRGHKFDKETLYSIEWPQGYIYTSQKEANYYKKAEYMFFKLKGKFSLNPTLEQMKKVYEILGLEVEND